MFDGFSPRTVDFMWGIRMNNEKSWFETHKDNYLQDFYNPMKALAEDVFGRLTAEHPGHGLIHKVARIYRDARRVRDGRPYRDLLWFSIEKPFDGEEWTSSTVFWFELNPENWYYAMGYFAKAAGMAKFRVRIDKNPKAFEKLIAPLDKQTEFVLEGDEYARKKPAPTPKTAAWYNRKQIILKHTQDNNDELYSPQLAERLANGFASLMPLYEYFLSIDSDPDP